MKKLGPEFNEEVLEALISEIAGNPRLKERFIEALLNKRRSSQ